MARQTEAIRRLVDRELDHLTPPSHSWHSQYSKSAYIYVGNLDPRLTEGDVITVFSQFGDIVDINMVRDRETGKSKGFCFLGYQDQRSTVVAIDNMIGFALLGRPLRLDHVSDYCPPRRYGDEPDTSGLRQRVEYRPTGAEGQGVGVYRVTRSQVELEKRHGKTITRTEEVDEDEKWAREFESMMKTEKVKQENR
jgi:RNA-binding motif X-linked protein 2